MIDQNTQPTPDQGLQPDRDIPIPSPRTEITEVAAGAEEVEGLETAETNNETPPELLESIGTTAVTAADAVEADSNAPIGEEIALVHKEKTNALDEAEEEERQEVTAESLNTKLDKMIKGFVEIAGDAINEIQQGEASITHYLDEMSNALRYGNVQLLNQDIEHLRRAFYEQNSQVQRIAAADQALRTQLEHAGIDKFLDAQEKAGYDMTQGALAKLRSTLATTGAATEAASQTVAVMQGRDRLAHLQYNLLPRVTEFGNGEVDARYVETFIQPLRDITQDTDPIRATFKAHMDTFNTQELITAT